MANLLRTLTADLHLHTVASACAEPEMTPTRIVRRAQELGLDLIAVTDHHSVENVKAVRGAAAACDLRVLPGMEVQTREEVHVLCLFDEMDRALSWQAWIWERLPDLPNREAFFGVQRVVDAAGNLLGTNGRLLQTSVSLSFEETLESAEAWGGIALPAHVDRPRYSLFANLGMIPQGVGLAGAEISRNITAPEARQRFPSLAGLGLIQSGDAHRLSEMIRTTRLVLEEPSVHEIRLALRGEAGRKVLLL